MVKGKKGTTGDMLNCHGNWGHRRWGHQWDGSTMRRKRINMNGCLKIIYLVTDKGWAEETCHGHNGL